MRLYRRCTRENVNHEFLRINNSNEQIHYNRRQHPQYPLCHLSTKTQDSSSPVSDPGLLYIKNLKQDNHANGRIINIKSRSCKKYVVNKTPTRQSFYNIRQNEKETEKDIDSESFVLSSKPFIYKTRVTTNNQSSIQQQPFNKKLFKNLQKYTESCKVKEKFIVVRECSKNVLKVLNLLVNFIYFNILRPLLFGYKNVQFLDSGFIDNIKTDNDKVGNNNNINIDSVKYKNDIYNYKNFGQKYKIIKYWHHKKQLGNVKNTTKSTTSTITNICIIFLNKLIFKNFQKFNLLKQLSCFNGMLSLSSSGKSTELYSNIKNNYFVYKNLCSVVKCLNKNIKLKISFIIEKLIYRIKNIFFCKKQRNRGNYKYKKCIAKKFYLVYKTYMELINGIDNLSNKFSYYNNKNNSKNLILTSSLNYNINNNNNKNNNCNNDKYKIKYDKRFFIKHLNKKIEHFLYKLLAQLKLKVNKKLISYNGNNYLKNKYKLLLIYMKKNCKICLMFKKIRLCQILRTKCNLNLIQRLKDGHIYTEYNINNNTCIASQFSTSCSINNYCVPNVIWSIMEQFFNKYYKITIKLLKCFNNNVSIYHMLKIPLRTIKSVFMIILLTCVPNISESFHHNIKYSTNIVKTKYGPLRGIIVRTNPTVEAFLGVPYASPPVGSLRYMPPVTPSTWRNARLSDRFSAVCPQAAPVPPTGPEALLEVPRGRLAQLRRLLPLLANQSEDCLYLNLYVPRTTYPSPSTGAGYGGDAGNSNSGGGTSTDDGSTTSNDKLVPAIVYIHGESYEWNSGNPYDGSVLAAHGNVIVVTINFRLGVLGFLKTGGKGSAQGNFGLMDLVAGLHWLRENLPAFGGDPNKVTVMGHGTGAALANILVVSPVASDLVHRAILLSGSALSPWAIQKDPIFVKRRVAEQTGCHGDLVEDDLAPCLRTKSISELLAVKIDSPRFLPGFAPFVDGTVIVHPSSSSTGPLTLPTGSAIASTSGIELADFPNRELLFGLTTIESYLELSAQDLEFGFNETRRDRILRTYVRNIYHYHLNEIYAALKNEYTDWERPARNPMGSRDAALELLSDGHTAAPLVRLGYLHSLRGGRSYFLHFRHQSSERDFPQRGGSVRGEDVPFCLGLPISPLFPHNYTKQDIKISRILLRYITNFVQTGNPNETPTASVDISHLGYSKLGLVSSSLTLSSPSSPSSLPTVPESEVAVIRQSEGLASSMPSFSMSIPSSSSVLPSSLSSSSSSSSYSSPYTLVKHDNDQYLPHVKSSLSLNPSPAAVNLATLSSSSASTVFAPSTATIYTGSGLSPLQTSASSSREPSDYLIDSVINRADLKGKIKRNVATNKRRRSKTVKRNLRQRSNFNSNKKHIRKKYPTSLDVSSTYTLSDQGVQSRKRPRAHYDNDLHEEEEEDEDEGAEDEEDEEDDGNLDEDEFDVGEEEEDEEEEVEENSARLRSHHSDEEEVEKYDRFEESSKIKLPFWDPYDAVNQLYLELGTRIEVRNHYRGHKLSMWLSLIPQLHSPADLSELPMRHHHFLEDSAQFYDGIIRPQITSRPSFPKVNLPLGPVSLHPVTTTTPKADVKTMNVGVPATTTECPPNTTIVPTIAATRPQNHQRNGTNPAGVISASGPDVKQDNNNLLRRLATSQYQSYTTALTVTIAVGCFLLLLNVLIFAGIYYQREKRANDAKKKEELREAENRCSSSPTLEKLSAGGCGGGGGGGTSGIGSGKGSRKSSLQSLTGFNSSGSFGEYSCYDEKIQCKEKHALADICSVELPLKEFKCGSSPSPSNTGSLRRTQNIQNSSSFVMYPPSYHHPQHQQPKLVHHFEQEQQDFTNNGVVTYQQFHKQHSSIPELQQTTPQPPNSGCANVGTSTELCNQSTQSEQPSVQDVGTNVDDKSVGCTESNIDDCSNHPNDEDDNMISPGIPDPPPPPKSIAPYQGGILRQPGPPTTPGSSKKRVQIQEISV